MPGGVAPPRPTAAARWLLGAPRARQRRIEFSATPPAHYPKLTKTHLELKNRIGLCPPSLTHSFRYLCVHGPCLPLGSWPGVPGRTDAPQDGSAERQLRGRAGARRPAGWIGFRLLLRGRRLGGRCATPTTRSLSLAITAAAAARMRPPLPQPPRRIESHVSAWSRAGQGLASRIVRDKYPVRISIPTVPPMLPCCCDPGACRIARLPPSKRGTRAMHCMQSSLAVDDSYDYE